MSLSRASTPALVGLAALSLVTYGYVERAQRPVHAKAFHMKTDAVRIMLKAEQTIAKVKRERGIAVDTPNDPDGTGVIGPQFTLVTTDRGSQSAKLLAAHPNFAAAVTQMLLQAKVRRGDLVAVGMTGSLPGFNIAVLSACKAIGCEPIIITSVGASMFGATDPELTWLDMEAVVAERGVWPYRSVAASVGGGGDVGRGLSPAGRQMLADAIERNHVQRLEPASLLEGVKQRVAIYDSVAAARHQRIVAYINVGGGVASLGGAQNGNLIPPGMSERLALRNYPNRGVINIMGERHMPIIHLLNVRRLARAYGITTADGATVPAGKGLLFVKMQYNLWLVGASILALVGANLAVLRIDLRQKLLGRLRPERTPAV